MTTATCKPAAVKATKMAFRDVSVAVSARFRAPTATTKASPCSKQTFVAALSSAARNANKACLPTKEALFATPLTGETHSIKPYHLFKPLCFNTLYSFNHSAARMSKFGAVHIVARCAGILRRFTVVISPHSAQVVCVLTTAFACCDAPLRRVDNKKNETVSQLPHLRK